MSDLERVARQPLLAVWIQPEPIAARIIATIGLLALRVFLWCGRHS